MTFQEQLQDFGDIKEDKKRIHLIKWEKINHAKIRRGG